MNLGYERGCSGVTSHCYMRASESGFISGICGLYYILTSIYIDGTLDKNCGADLYVGVCVGWGGGGGGAGHYLNPNY